MDHTDINNIKPHFINKTVKPSASITTNTLPINESYHPPYPNTTCVTYKLMKKDMHPGKTGLYKQWRQRNKLPKNDLDWSMDRPIINGDIKYSTTLIPHTTSFDINYFKRYQNHTKLFNTKIKEESGFRSRSRHRSNIICSCRSKSKSRYKPRSNSKNRCRCVV